MVTITVSNKNTHLADFETCVFRGFLRNHLSYKRVTYIYMHPCLKSFQIKKNIFEIRSQNQLIFTKTLFCQKKVSYWKKSAKFQNQLDVYFCYSLYLKGVPTWSTQWREFWNVRKTCLQESEVIDFSTKSYTYRCIA